MGVKRKKKLGKQRMSRGGNEKGHIGESKVEGHVNILSLGPMAKQTMNE